MRYLKAFTGTVTNLWLWFTYRLTMWRLGISEEYIRTAFSALTEMDLDEFKKIEGRDIELKAWGNEVHIRRLGTHWAPGAEIYQGKRGILYECVIKEGIRKDVYVDEWRKETREVTLEYGAKHQTHWWEVYRTGRWIRSTRFVDYLKILYGEKIHAVQVAKAAGLDVRKPPANGEEIRPAYGFFNPNASGSKDESQRPAGAAPKELRLSDELPRRE